MKRRFCLLFAFLLLLGASSALADGAPASQFGFKGWPYRQSVSCSLGCSQCQDNQDCSFCAYCQGVRCTARPAGTVKPASTPVPAPSPRPTPALRPTVRPQATPQPRPTVTPSASTGDYTTISVGTQEQKVLNLLNSDRIANGLPALQLDAELSRLARLKSCDMNSQHYFAHESPTYGNAASMLTQFGYAYKGVGENIAHHATVEKAEAAFMSSPGHRTNILGRQWTKVGVGVCVDSNGFVYVTQLFVR